MTSNPMMLIVDTESSKSSSSAPNHRRGGDDRAGSADGGSAADEQGGVPRSFQDATRGNGSGKTAYDRRKNHCQSGCANMGHFPKIDVWLP